jgi:hypothetical protein
METSPTPEVSVDSFLKKREELIILLIIALAALRIFLFNAAFPFFNNVDEQLHFDMAYKYAKGDLPKKGNATFSPGSAELIALYETKEYTHRQEQFRAGRFPPPLWTFPHAKESHYYKTRVSFWDHYENREAWHFPLPYMIEGLWFNTGEVLGMKGGYLLYWLRFLNIPVFVLLVWLSWITAKGFFPDQPLMRIGLPLILAFFPQDIFYAITNDTFSALFCGLAFFLLIQLYFREKSFFYHAIAGLSVAAAFLSKASNIAIPVLLILIAILKIKKLLAQKEFRKYLSKLLVLLLFAGVPVLAVFLRNKLILGDFLGTAEALKITGWTKKSFFELWNHPIFTLNGLSYFLSGLTKTFWRGEFVWHGERMAYRWADFLYLFTTGLFLSLSFYSLFSKKGESKKHFVLLTSFIVLFVSVLFLAFLSIRFDFGDFYSPSRKSPYFSQGRLISGATVPFLILYINGLKVLFAKAGRYFHPIFIVLIIVILISVSEISLTLPVFKSQFNWFHLLSSRPVF